MKMKLILFIVSLTYFLPDVSAAPPAWAYRVVFKNKAGTLTFADSLQFLSTKALERRSKQGILLDSTDLPVVQAYIDTVMTTAAAVKLHNVSKWFNQVVVITLDSMKRVDLAALPMVDTVILVARYPNGVFKTDATSTYSLEKFPKVQEMPPARKRGSSAFYGVAFQQIDIMQGDFLHDMGYWGDGMDIAIFDVNFRYANTCAAYDSLNTAGRIKDVYNFARDTPFVFSTSIPNDHGMNVLGCMAAYIPGTYVGTAPKANFHLYITEDWLTEQPIEEDNWLSAAERSDSLGIYLINSSLGYNKFPDLPTASYTYANLDGKTTLISKAANMAVRKGIFVVNAQGNEGASSWHYMLPPADADSVYSVGTVDGSGSWGNSGFGPTYDGRMKPDGCAMGRAAMLIGGSCNPGTSNGSSFASPMMCGSITCLWQSAPAITAFQLRRIVHMCSDRYLNPNYTHGYGIPNFELARALITGTSDVQQVDYTFAVYPNPSDGSLYIRSYDLSVNKFRWSLFDQQGRQLIQSDWQESLFYQTNVLQHLPAGTYHLWIQTPLKSFSTSIIRK